MSESITMPREQFRSSQEPLTFDATGEQAADFLHPNPEDADAAVAEAEAFVRDTYEQMSGDRLVFPDKKRGHFEIASPEQRNNNVRVEPSMLDDAWREQVESRRLAAAQEAEAQAAERELVSAVSADTRAMTTTRDHVTQYGMNAE